MTEHLAARFKTATGMSDRELAALIGLARSTIQAGLAGRQRLHITPEARARLAKIVTERREMLKRLSRELTD